MRTNADRPKRAIALAWIFHLIGITSMGQPQRLSETATELLGKFSKVGPRKLEIEDPQG